MRNFSEDFEREAQKDEVYLMEKRIEIEAAWQQWEEEQRIKHKLPAKIVVIKVEEHEIQPNSLPF